MPMPPLTRSDLDKMGCGHVHADGEVCGNKGVLHIMGVCHPGAGNRVSYADGVLRITCRKCSKRIADVAVDGNAGRG